MSTITRIAPDQDLYNTPPVTRGVILQNPSNSRVHVEQNSVGIHWLQGVGTFKFDDYLDYCFQLGVGDWERQKHGRHGYGSAVRNPEGIELWYNPKTKGMPEFAVQISGDACDTLGHDLVCKLGLPLRLTRVDVAFDRHDLSPRRIRWAFERKLARTKIRRWRWDENQDGQTFTLGKRGTSTHQVQCYNMRGFNRLELRLFKERANAFQEQGGLLSDLKTLSAIALGMLRQAIDFVDPNSDSNRSRMALLPWWAEFVKNVPKAAVKLPRRVVSLAGTMDWVRRHRAAFATYLVGTLRENGYDCIQPVTDAQFGQPNHALKKEWYPDARILLAGVLREGLQAMTPKHWGALGSIR